MNKDGQEDYVFMVKATNKKNIVKGSQGEIDRNRRGIIIAFKNDDRYDVVLKNMSCFSSENEEGGVYFAPELDLDIKKEVCSLIMVMAGMGTGYTIFDIKIQVSS